VDAVQALGEAAFALEGRSQDASWRSSRPQATAIRTKAALADISG